MEVFMHAKILTIAVAGIILCAQGCATGRGIKKDVVSTVKGVTGDDKDSWVQKTDRWIQEHLW
jgi:hypothetical protein